MVGIISTQLNEACDQGQTVETCCEKEKNKILVGCLSEEKVREN